LPDADARLDLTLRKGDPRLPAVVFVHGLGMRKTVWTAPDRARVMGGMFSMGALLRDYPAPRSLFHDLAEMGFTAAAWSQQRPAGPAEAAVGELEAVMAEALGHTRAGLVLIGHSRGGLVARAALDRRATGAAGQVRALVTLSSPHRGSTLARWAVLVAPLSPVVARIVPEAEEGTLRAAMRKAAAFLESAGVRELLPGSEFLREMAELAPLPGPYRLSAGGTDPELFVIRGNRGRGAGQRRLSFPGMLTGVLPRGFLPEEIVRGKGDGLVSEKSSRLPGAHEHLKFPLNHAEMLVDPAVRDAVRSRLLLALGVEG